jgi:uncharacterized protein YgiM (DUF1202 family)
MFKIINTLLIIIFPLILFNLAYPLDNHSKNTGIVLDEKINVWNKPDKNADIIKTLKKGTNFKILEKIIKNKETLYPKNFWYKIDYNKNSKGYVKSEYVFTLKNLFRKWILSTPERLKGSITFYKNNTFHVVMQSQDFTIEIIKKIPGAQYAFTGNGKFKIIGNKIKLNTSILLNPDIKVLYLYRYKGDNFLVFEDYSVKRNFGAQSPFEKIWRYY